MDVNLEKRPSSSALRSFPRRILDAPWSCPAILALLLVSESVNLALQAGRKMFWFDELLTLHITGLKPFSVVLQALHAGLAGMTPGYYGMVGLSRSLPGDPHLLLRLPSLAGYTLTLLAAYLFASRRLSAAAGLVAALLIALSPFRQYAVEARSYAPLVGCFALAAVLWQRIGDRRFLTPPFAVVLALAVSLHHLAVVGISLFGLAELMRTWLSRRIRRGVWIAFVAATLPFLANLPILLHFKSLFGGHFWAPPKWGLLVGGYYTFTGLERGAIGLVCIPLALFALVLGRFLWKSLRDPAAAMSPSGFQPPEVALIGGFIFYPALLLALAIMFHSGYTPRYGWPAIFGLSLGVVYLLGGVRQAPRMGTLLGALLLAFAVQSVNDLGKIPGSGPLEDERWGSVARLSREHPGLPVVMENPMQLVEALQYGPPALRAQLVGFADPDLAVQGMGTNSRDLSVTLLAKFVPLRVEDHTGFENAHRTFLFQTGNEIAWPTRYLLSRSYRLTLLAMDHGGAVYLAER